MKKTICVILSALLIFFSMSAGFMSFAVDSETTTQEDVQPNDGRIDLTKEGGKEHTTFWRIFVQLWIEIYYFFVDIIAMAKA